MKFLRLVLLLLSVTFAVGKIHKLNWAVKSGDLGTTSIAAGDTVQWTWTDAKPHSVTSLGSPSFTSSSVVTGKGYVYKVVFSTAGSYSYDCSIHSKMKGIIKVT